MAILLLGGARLDPLQCGDDARGHGHGADRDVPARDLRHDRVVGVPLRRRRPQRGHGQALPARDVRDQRREARRGGQPGEGPAVREVVPVRLAERDRGDALAGRAERAEVDPEPAAAGLLREADRRRPGGSHRGGGAPCVTYGKKITDRVLNTLKYVLYFVFGLMLLLGIAAVVLIQNTIRLSIFSRRREIEVMKLVGATNAFVRLPFMLEGMLTGMLGALGAVVLLAAVYVTLNGYDRGLTDPARLVGVPFVIALLAMFGLLLGAFGSGITLRRFLRT